MPLAVCGLDRDLELARAGAGKLVAEQTDQRSADHKTQGESEIDVDAVRGARAAAAEVLERPRALDRLQLPLLLLP